MPPKKRQNSAAEIAALLDKSWSDGTQDVVPLNTPLDVARYYNQQSKKQFYVPGYNAPTQKMQVFIDRNQPFTRKAKLRDPITGLVRESGLGSKKTVGEWLNMFLLQLNGYLEEYKTKKYDTEKATDWINASWRELAGLYTHIRQLSNSPYVSDVQRGRARKALEKIGSLAKVGVDHELASKIEKAGDAAFQNSKALLNTMISTPEKSSLNGAEASALLASLLSIASENPKYAKEKEDLMGIKQRLAETEKERITTDSAKLVQLVTAIGNLEADKAETAKQVVLRQLRSAKGEFSVMLNTKSWKPETQQLFAGLLVELLTLKQQKSSAHLYAVAKAFELHYAPATFSAGQFDAKFFSASSKGVLSQFSAAGEATATYQRLAKVPVAGKVCESIDPGTTVEFFKLYGQYHQIMLATLIFYYTSCSPSYKNKDITPLAEDWVTWLRTGPFHLVDLPKVRDMRPEVWNRIAPQSFLQFALPGTDTTYSPETVADQMGIKWNDIKDTRKTYIENFEELEKKADQIWNACDNYIKTPVEPGKPPKAPLSEQSKRVLFLANFTRNAMAIIKGLRKAGYDSISWKKEGNTVTRQVEPKAGTYCEFNLDTLGKKYRAASGTPVPPIPETTGTEQPEPEILIPAIEAPGPEIIVRAKWVDETKPDQDLFPNEPAGTTEIILSPNGGYDFASDKIAGIIQRATGSTVRFAWVNGQPVDTSLPESLQPGSLDANKFEEKLVDLGLTDSRYIQVLSKAYRSNALTTDGKFILEISNYPNKSELYDFLVTENVMTQITDDAALQAWLNSP